MTLWFMRSLSAVALWISGPLVTYGPMGYGASSHLWPYGLWGLVNFGHMGHWTSGQLWPYGLWVLWSTWTLWITEPLVGCRPMGLDRLVTLCPMDYKSSDQTWHYVLLGLWSPMGMALWVMGPVIGHSP